MTAGFIELQDFIPSLSGSFQPPRHLRPLTDLFQRIAAGEEVQAVTHVPPRHAKTETILHGIAWLLVQHPGLQIGYATYAQRLAEKKSRRCRGLTRRAGVPLANDSKSRSDWRTGVYEGGVWATSTGGSITGEGFDLLVLDDLVRGRADAESAAMRDRARDWLIADVLTRLEPGGSVILNGTRWHPEDPAGVALGLGWENIRLPALDDWGLPLWPERWSQERLLKLRDTTMGGPQGYEWLSLYQGLPPGRGSRVFGDVHFYDVLPDGLSVTIGLDFGYSSRTSADPSVAVVLGSIGETRFVLDVLRVREEPRAFRDRLRALLARYEGATVAAYAAATEMGGIEFLRESGIPITAHVARVDKFSRAIPVTAAWNTGKVLLPRSAPWLDSFVSEVCGFTGVHDRHDDQIDALAAAFDAVTGAWTEEDRKKFRKANDLNLPALSRFDDFDPVDSIPGAANDFAAPPGTRWPPGGGGF